MICLIQKKVVSLRVIYLVILEGAYCIFVGILKVG